MQACGARPSPVGAGLPAIAVCQSLAMLPVSPPSRASLLPQGIGLGGVATQGQGQGQDQAPMIIPSPPIDRLTIPARIANPLTPKNHQAFF